MFLSPSRRPSVLRPLSATGTALLLSCALLAGCGDAAAKAESDTHRALAEALAAYGSIATSHLAVTDKAGVPPVVYAAPTVLGASAANPKPTWQDLSLLAARSDQYAAVAARFKEIVASPAATPVQKAVAGATLSEIQRLRARQLLRRADLNRAALARMTAGLEVTLGKIEAEMLGRAPARGHSVITLVEQGGVDGKITSLPDLAKAVEAAAADIEKLSAEVKVAEEGKQSLRAKADALYAKEAELKVALRRAYGKEHFDLVDQASRVRCEAETAEAAFSSQDMALEVLSRRLALAAKSKVSLESAIVGYEEQRDGAKKDLASFHADTGEAVKKAAELHDQWIAEAKVFDAQFSEKVDGPLAAAVALVKEAQDTLAKAAKDAGKDAPEFLPTLGLDQAGLAVELAQGHVLRLRALEAHKSALRELAAREKAWLPDQADSFVPARIEAMAQTQAASAQAGLAACGEAETAVTAALGGKVSEEGKTALEGVQANIADYRKIVKELAKDLPAVVQAAPEAPAAEAKPEAAAEEVAKEEPKADSADAPKEEPAAPEAPKEEAAKPAAETPVEVPVEVPAVDKTDEIN